MKDCIVLHNLLKSMIHFVSSDTFYFQKLLDLVDVLYVQNFGIDLGLINSVATFVRIQDLHSPFRERSALLSLDHACSRVRIRDSDGLRRNQIRRVSDVWLRAHMTEGQVKVAHLEAWIDGDGIKILLLWCPDV